MASAKQLTALKKLREFFQSEIQAEARSGFARLTRVPDSHVVERLRYYGLLGEADKRAFLDCSAHWASAFCGFLIKMPRLNLTDHPFFSHWSQGPSWNRDFNDVRSVPLLRSLVRQYKIDRHNKVRSHVSKEQFNHASSIHSVKAPELRKRVREALKPFGHYETDWLGNYWCKRGKQKFFVNVNFSGRYAQLRYYVGRPEYKVFYERARLGFEPAMGFGFGHWDYIIEENVGAAFALFVEIVQYSLDLPDRVRAATK